MRLLAKLGRDVERSWRRAGRELAGLPSVAAAALRVLDASEIDELALARRLVVDRRLPPQLSVPFGDAQVTAWRGDDVLVQLVYWLDGATAIHQHGFAGAFRVLRGASLHSTHTFVARRKIDQRFQIGTLERQQLEVLGVGDVREIGAGSALIHNLIHVKFPSVTLVIRTPFQATLSPQWSYHPPGVAVDPLADDPDRRARERLFEVCARLDERASRDVAKAIVDRGLSASWDLLDARVAEVGDGGLEPYLQMIRRRHGADGRLIADAFVRSRVRMRLFRLRAQFPASSFRTLLAVLADGGDRDTVIGIIRHLYPGDEPAAHIERWLPAVAKPLGVVLDRSGMRVVRRLIEGVPGAAIAAEVRGYSVRDVAALARAFRRSLLFAALLSKRRGPVTRTSIPRSRRTSRRPESSARRR
jgi:hypothetical protein